MFQLEDILENAQRLERHGNYKKARHLYKRLQKKAPDSEIAKISEERLVIINAQQNTVEKQNPPLPNSYRSRTFLPLCPSPHFTVI